jgi:Ca2+-binding RTX toxin-like protein
VENITGGSGNDTLTGGTGSDTINGGAGDDSIAGGPPGNSCTDDVDVLNGNDGDDVFVMGGFSNCGDALDGGAGRDVADYQMRASGVNFLADTVANDGQAGEADKVLATVEIILGGGANDTMTGGTGNDELHGGPGADILSGGAGNDSIVGGPGADTLLGGAGEDYFNETDKVDQYADSEGTLHDSFLMRHFGSPVGPGQPDIINGGADFDSCDYGRTSTTAMTVTLCRNDTNVTTGNACTTGATDTVDLDDVVNCDDFVAGAGSDTITGSTGDDMISGGWGADSIVGGEGNDELNGNLTTGGTDTINGGLGQDICGTATTITSCEI